MDDWDEPADEEREPAAAFGPVLRAAAADPEAVDALASFLAEAKSPGAGRGCGCRRPGDVGGARRAGRAARRPPSSRSRSEAAPASRRTTGCIAAFCRRRGRDCASGWSRTTRSSSSARRRSVRRRTRRAASPLRQRGSRCSATIPTRLHRSPAELAVLAPPAVVLPRARGPCAGARRRAAGARFARRPPPSPPAPGEALSASHVLAALAERLPRDAVVVEEAPVDRPEIHATAARPRASRLPQRRHGRPRLRDAGGRRSAHGLAAPARRGRRRRRLGDLRRPGRLERCALRDRRALRRPLERALRRHGPARRAPRRHRPLAGVRRGRAGDDRARLRLSRLGGSRRTTS